MEALKGGRTVSKLAAEYDLHSTMIHQWSKSLSAIGSRTMASTLLDGAADIFERGSKKSAAEGDEERSHPSLRCARDHEYGSGKPVHVFRLDRQASAGGDPDLDGWKGALHRQCLHRAPVAFFEIRVRLPARRGNRIAGR